MSAFHTNESDDWRHGGARHYGGGGQAQLFLCGNQRTNNDFWSLYNRLWTAAKFYYTNPVHQMVYMQQAPRFFSNAIDYTTWKWFWMHEVIPRSPNANLYQWMISPSMPFIHDTSRRPGKNHFSYEWLRFVHYNPLVSNRLKQSIANVRI